MEDKLLVLRCKRGSIDALGRIYEKYKTDMLVLAMALLNDTSAAEDVVHDVFLTFVQRIERFRLIGSLKGFLLTCVANRARNTIKAKYRQSVELDPAEIVSSGSNDPPRSTNYSSTSCSPRRSSTPSEPRSSRGSLSSSPRPACGWLTD